MAGRSAERGARLLTELRPASTVVLLRDAPDGLITYVLVRNDELVFAPGATVFPGGAVDPEDHDAPWAEEAVGCTSAQADAHLETNDGMTYWVAAARECYEEVGVLLGGTGSVDRSTTFAQHVDAGRVPIMRDMWYFGHWITPVGAPRRYDTRFFLTIVGDDVDPDPDRGELISGRWMRPDAALQEFADGKIDLIDPTERTLRTLATIADTVALRAVFRGRERQASEMLRQGRAGARIRFPHDPAK